MGKRRRIDSDTETAEEPTLNEVVKLFNALESKLQKAIPINRKTVPKKAVESISSSFSDLKEKVYALIKQNSTQKSAATPTSNAPIPTSASVNAQTSNTPSSTIINISNIPANSNEPMDFTHHPNELQQNQTDNGNSKSTGKFQRTVKRISGFVKWYDYKKCYGFISYENNTKQIFAHKSSIIKSRTENKKYRTLRQNESIEFDISTDQNGKLYASNITGPAGTNVIGLKNDEIIKMKAEKTSTQLSNTFFSSFKTTNYNPRNASNKFPDIDI